VALVAVAVAVVCLLPFAIAAGGDMADQTIGFIGIAGQQRLPFPLDPTGIGLDPNKLLELWFPLILVAGSVLWLGWALLRRPAAQGWAMAPLIAAGVAYLLARTDEFHLVRCRPRWPSGSRSPPATSAIAGAARPGCEQRCSSRWR